MWKAGDMDIATDLFSSSPREAAIDALHAATAIYTCEHIVDQLLDRVRWPRDNRSLVDTSCGDGAFLRRALERLLAQQPGLEDGALLQRIAGWEIHPCAAGLARLRVAEVLRAHGYARERADALAHRMVRCGDFLTEGPKGPAYDTVVGNPPYLRFVNVPEPLRGIYEQELPDYAVADLLHSFLDRSALVLRPDGELAMITSDRWVLNQGAAGLREAIGRRFRMAHLERVDVNSAFYRPKHRRAGTPPRVHPCAVVLNAQHGAPITRDPIYPGVAASGRQSCGPTLGDVACIHLAPWLGTPGIFLVNSDVAARLPVECLVPAVDTDDIRGGLLRSPSRYAIRTEPGVRPPQAVLDHLAREMPRMSRRGMRSRTPWLPPEPFHGLDLSSPCLVVPRIAKALSPVRLPAGLLAINHNITIRCLQGHTLEQIAAHLESPEAASWINAMAAPLESGYRAITATLLRQLPM